MSTFPVQTAAGVSLDISGSEIKTTYTATSLGDSMAMGAYARLTANLALTWGTVTTYTARITVQTTPGGAWKPVMSVRRDKGVADEDLEHAMTAADFSDLLTTNHAGSIYQRIEVVANVTGGIGDAVYGALVGVAP